VKQLCCLTDGEEYTYSREKSKMREHPILVATRMTERERKLIGVAAALEGTTVKDYLRRVVLPVAKERVARAAEELRDDFPAAA
jgi:uncharacterized protein (DUF1778 family)